MSTPTPPPLEPTAVLTLIMGAFAGPALASVFGPYAVIIVAALAGAGWALSDETGARTTWSAIWFLMRITATAAVLTSFIVAGIERYVVSDAAGSRWLIAPVAFGIGAIGNGWPALLRWIAEQARERIGVRLRKRKGGDDAG